MSLCSTLRDFLDLPCVALNSSDSTTYWPRLFLGVSAAPLPSPPGCCGRFCGSSSHLSRASESPWAFTIASSPSAFSRSAASSSFRRLISAAFSSLVPVILVTFDRLIWPLSLASLKMAPSSACFAAISSSSFFSSSTSLLLLLLARRTGGTHARDDGLEFHEQPQSLLALR